MDRGSDTESFLYWAKRMNERGHATMFGRGSSDSEKAVIEESVLHEWANSARAEFSMNIEGLRPLRDDPPDAQVDVDGKCNSVELVELVDGGIIASIKAARKKGMQTSSHHGQLFRDSQWDQTRFQEMIEATIKNKDELYHKRDIKIDYLVIYSDEPWLAAIDVERWSSAISFNAAHSIHHVHILLTYQPSYRKHWPIFRAGFA